MRIKHHELLALMHPFFATPKKHKTIHQEGLNPERAGWYSLDDHANEEDIQGLRQRNEEFLTKRAEGRDRITMMLKKKREGASFEPCAAGPAPENHSASEGKRHPLFLRDPSTNIRFIAR